MGERVRLTGEVLAVYLRARWLLRRHELPAALALLREPAEHRAQGEVERESVVGSRLSWVVARILPLLPTDSRCLSQSVTLSALLARRGIESRIVIGVRAEPEFAAHAWVEHDGRPLLPTEAGYQRLYEV